MKTLYQNHIELTDEKFNEIYNNIDFCISVKNSHWQADRNGVKLYRITCTYPLVYIPTEKQIEDAQKEYLRAQNQFVESMQKNTIYFVGMGMNFPESDFSDICNFRIRAYLKNAKNELYFVEFSGNNERDAFFCDHSISFPDGNIEEEKHNNFKNLERETLKGYNKKNILNIVNNIFNCNFSDLQIDTHFLSSNNISFSTL